MLAPDALLREQYRITYVLDQQSEAIIYRAFDSEADRRVLICALPQADGYALGNVAMCATQVVAAQGPHLLALENHFAHDGAYYLVCADPEGQDLERVARGRGSPLPESEVLALVEQLLATLEALHNHTPPLRLTSLTPTDLWVDAAQTLWLTPFALVRTSRHEQASYHAPELNSNNAEASVVSDVYASGAVCYQLLTGWAPPSAAQRAAGVPLNPPRILNAHISTLVEQVVLRALAWEPAQRYAQIAALRQALITVQQLDPPTDGESDTPALAAVAHTSATPATDAPGTDAPAAAAVPLGPPPPAPPPVPRPPSWSVPPPISPPASTTAATTGFQLSNGCLIGIVILLFLIAIVVTLLALWVGLMIVR
ncbi:hypothetical protein [Candidatus Viridilinea mediisalina]|uniref:non-specific serine/threonine protein kinase n=1 Tax=Candidatus Viridilinea mediisalina TaxID=2024553 RepID=A0A2A6RIJ4_9CHLR|nr:hypothetical protein [Candidatus Viridilinea mediisalina]PDW02688.1 hypothetical protein CJ255_12580 [Candidatus Viridilinea mediisalina]